MQRLGRRVKGARALKVARLLWLRNRRDRSNGQVAELVLANAFAKKMNESQVARRPDKICGRIDFATQFRGILLTARQAVFSQMSRVVLDLIPGLRGPNPLDHQ